MSPKHYARLSERNAYVGSRLRVPHVLHDELRTKLGGTNPEVELQRWYDELNAAAELSGEAIPDVFTWLRPRFVSWASERAFVAELEKFRPKGA